MSRRVFPRLLAAAVVSFAALLSGSVAATTSAAPGDPADPPPAPGVTLAWRTLGLKPQMFLGPDSTNTVKVPVPVGLNATRLLGTIHAPTNIKAGFLEIQDGAGRLLAAVDLPPATSAQATTPIDVDISTARNQASAVDLSFTLRTTDDADGFCGPLQQVVLSDFSTVFSGAEVPATTIANFFPPVLQKAVIYAPADADTAEQQSVLTLASALTRLYQPQPLSVSVVTRPRGTKAPPAGQFERAIVVEAGGSAGLTVDNPGAADAQLRVSGRGDELSTQVSLLVDQLQSLAQVPAARVDQAAAQPDSTGDALTFEQLKMTGKTDVLRTGSVTVGVDRSALGNGRVDGVQVHLLADYTPVPRDDAASVVIRSNNLVVYRAALDSSGRLDATFDLQSQTFNQYLNLDLALTYTPHQVCGPMTAPLTFQIDPRSTLTLHRGGPPPNGFTALPSELSPSFVVALDGTDPDQLVLAARAVAGIARLTTQPLTPKVVDVKTALDTESGALILANSATLAKTTLNPPVSLEGTTVKVGLPVELRLNLDGGLGSIQAFADRPHNRSVVLVTTTGAWSLVDPLFAYLDGLEGGWSQLTGDVLAAGAAGAPVNVAIRAGDNTLEAVPARPAESTRWWLPVVVGAAVLAVLATVAAIWWMRRRRSSS